MTPAEVKQELDALFKVCEDKMLSALAALREGQYERIEAMAGLHHGPIATDASIADLADKLFWQPQNAGHTCGGATIATARKSFPLKSVPKSPEATELADAHPGEPASPIAAASVETGISAAFTSAEKRKEYLKLKARERRARERAAKEATC